MSATIMTQNKLSGLLKCDVGITWANFLNGGIQQQVLMKFTRFAFFKS